MLSIIALTALGSHAPIILGQDAIDVSIGSIASPAETLASPAFRLSHDGASSTLDFAHSAELALRDLGLSSRIGIAKKYSAQPLALRNASALQSIEYQFAVDGMPLCQFQVKAHQALDGASLVLGSMPRVEPRGNYSLEQWGSVADMDAWFETVAQGRMPGAKVVKTGAAPCLWLADEVYRTVWIYEADIDAHPYRVVLDREQVYEFVNVRFDLDASVKVYDKNPKDRVLSNIKVKDMDATGYLQNKYFNTCVPATSKGFACPPQASNVEEYAMSSDSQFVFDPSTDSSRFMQSSAFAHANRALEWFQSIGYDSFGKSKIRILLHANVASNTYKASYEPKSGSPQILIADGDGVRLDDLAKDSDVISHELAHHVIYGSVKNIQGESLILHEGLADFFTFARTGDSCLAESICIAEDAADNICARPLQCLRSAKNNWTLNDASYSRASPHERSQLVSGLLWDLHEKDGIELDVLSRMSLQAVEALVADSGFRHLILALLLADRSLENGMHCNTIKNRAIERGFDSYLSGVSCENLSKYLARGGTSKKLARDSAPEPVKKSAKKNPLGCGVVGVASDSIPAQMSILVLWLLPVLLCLRRLWL